NDAFLTKNARIKEETTINFDNENNQDANSPKNGEQDPPMSSHSNEQSDAGQGSEAKRM
ncbi:hypothetical protein COBT_003837, partial [Conglomerata obtusa]